jgi:hypothetical protein
LTNANEYNRRVKQLKAFYSSVIFRNDKMFKLRWMLNNALADPDYFTPIKWTGMYDHTQVFQHFWKILKCNGLENMELLIQCGGHGTIRRTLTVLLKPRGH